MRNRLILLLMVMVMFSAASWADTLDFSSPSVEPTGASLSYAGGSAALIASGIDVSSVADISTALSTNCFGCTLSFSSGANTGGWSWSGGGTLDITGSAGGASGTLLDGTITSAAVVACGGSTCIDVNTFINTVNSTLQNFFGISPSDPNWAGSSSLNIVLSEPVGSAFSLNHSQIGSGDLTTTSQAVPEPSSLLLLMLGVAGLSFLLVVKRDRLLA
jgi:hypothetical protein